MSLRKGSLEEYYNSGPGAKSAGCGVKPGNKPTCYQDKILINIESFFLKIKESFGNKEQVLK